MNDFTKQELEDIAVMARHFIKQGIDSAHNLTPEIRQKAQGMIDNYDKPCEHKNCRRVSLLDGHDYDICPNCDFIRQIR